MGLQTLKLRNSDSENNLLLSSWGSERTKVKFKILFRNGKERIPGYGVTIPRHIARNFLHTTHFIVSQSGTAIIYIPVEKK